MWTSTLSSLLLALSTVNLVNACPGIDHSQGLSPRSNRVATQPSGSTSLIRPLTWATKGGLNVIHTTDIHGWYQGHLKSSEPEPNYSGDWGDFASFVELARRKADREQRDLLIVDSGDLHDGAGLSDADPKVDAHTSNQFHSMIKYDLLAVGNHELYVYANALDTYKNFIPQQKGRYMGSNVNISMADPHHPGKNVSLPFGERFVKFKTKHGVQITSFGVLFNFTGADAGLSVQPADQMVKERWFIDAVKQEPDAFVVIGHSPVRGDNTFPIVFEAIRKVHPQTPLLFLGGHQHLRDCVQYDGRSMALESGRYLETIGWLSANLSQASPTGNISFSRSYIDANRRNYAFHSDLSKHQHFDTAKGVHITNAMAKIADEWNLTQVFGKAPQDYYLARYSPDNTSSLLNLLTNEVLPTVISTSNPDRKSIPNIVLANSGSQRFDIYSGNFTKNDQYIVSPFKDAFLYLSDVPYSAASQLVGKLNGDEEAGANSRRSASEAVAYSASARSLEAEKKAELEAKYSRGEIDHIFNEYLKNQVRNEEERRALTPAQEDLMRLDARAEAQKTLGYVTSDLCGNGGDDTEHIAIPYASQPDYVASPLTGNTSAVTDDTKVDVIFVDFILSSVVRLLNSLQSEKTFSSSDSKPYNSLTTQDLYPLYAEAKWQ